LLQTFAEQVQPLRAPFSVTRSGLLSLQPGGETLSVGFSPLDGRAYQEQLVLSQEDPQCPDTTLFLAGAGKPSVLVPPTLDFGVIPVGVTSERTVTLFNGTSAPSNLQFSVAGDFLLSASSARVEPMSASELTVRTTPRMSGRFSGTVFVDVMGAGTQFIVVEASAGVPRLELDSTVISLPTIPLAVDGGLPLRRTISYVNGGDGPLSIDRVEVSPENFTSNALEVSVPLPQLTFTGEMGHLAVTFSPKGAPGPRALRRAAAWIASWQCRSAAVPQ
jgi:hypothetical protein